MNTTKAAVSRLLLTAISFSFSLFFLETEACGESCPPGYHPGNMHGKRVCKQINGPGYLPLGACPPPPPPSTETSTETSTEDPKEDTTTDPEIPQTVKEQQAVSRIHNRKRSSLGGELKSFYEPSVYELDIIFHPAMTEYRNFIPVDNLHLYSGDDTKIILHGHEFLLNLDSDSAKDDVNAVGDDLLDAVGPDLQPITPLA